MGFISEIQYPTRWYSKLLAAVLALAFFWFVATLAISGFILYRIVSPAPSQTNLDFSNFPGHPEDMTYQVRGEGSRDGWFFPGRENAPTIVLCPGYQQNRGELLTLASALQYHEYNVFLFDFSGQGTSPGRSLLGYRETVELKAVIDALAQRDDVDRSHFGLWGTNMGGYAAMAEAESDPRVAAFAVESVYDRPEEELDLLVSRSGLGAMPLITRATHWDFDLLARDYRGTPPLSTGLGRLADVPKLYIEAADEPELSESTHDLFVNSPDPSQEAVIARGNYVSMLDDDKHSYENRLVSFFLTNLPPASRAHR
ncbi:MAG: alpha/beta fold hydrolase [Candidatus Acidiferrales bacterium]